MYDQDSFISMIFGMIISTFLFVFFGGLLSTANTCDPLSAKAGVYHAACVKSCKANFGEQAAQSVNVVYRENYCVCGNGKTLKRNMSKLFQ